LEYWNKIKGKKATMLLNPLFHRSIIPLFHS
jgi:hypothetical protein